MALYGQIKYGCIWTDKVWLYMDIKSMTLYGQIKYGSIWTDKVWLYMDR